MMIRKLIAKRTTLSSLKRLTSLLLIAVLIVAQIGCEKMRAQQLFRTATELGAQKQWLQAMHYYERLWVQYPTNDLVDEAKLRAARIAAGPGNEFRDAQELYRDVIIDAQSEEMRITALLELEDHYMQRQQLDAAIELLEVYLQRFANDETRPEITLDLAQMYMQKGRFFQAVQEASPFTTTTNLDDKVAAYLIIGQSQELMGYTEPAYDTYGETQEMSEPGSQTWLTVVEGKARILETLEQWGACVETLRALQQYHPNPDAIERWVMAVEERHTEMGR